MSSITAQIKDQPCGFAKIPPEIRMMIYRLCIPSEWKALDTHHDLEPQIINCCRTFYQEAGSLLFGDCTFYIRVRDNSVQWLGRRRDFCPDFVYQPAHWFKRIQKVHIDIVWDLRGDEHYGLRQATLLKRVLAWLKDNHLKSFEFTLYGYRGILGPPIRDETRETCECKACLSLEIGPVVGPFDTSYFLQYLARLRSNSPMEASSNFMARLREVMSLRECSKLFCPRARWIFHSAMRTMIESSPDDLEKIRQTLYGKSGWRGVAPMLLRPWIPRYSESGPLSLHYPGGRRATR